MFVSPPVTRDDRVIFARGERSFTERDVIDWGLLHGVLEKPWRESQRAAAGERLADEKEMEVDSSAVDSASIAFRYAHDLITGEETERWLEDRGLTLSDFSGYFTRRQWGKTIVADAPSTEFPEADIEEKTRFAIDLILAGELDRWAEDYSRRIATQAANGSVTPTTEERAEFFQRAGLKEESLSGFLEKIGRDQEWFDNVLAGETAYQRQKASLVTEKDLARELISLRLLLTCFELETVEVDSRNAAAEVVACVRTDGMEMAEVAEEGRYPYRSETVLLEDLPAGEQQRLLAAKAGALLDPVPRDDAFEVSRVRTRTEPTTADAAVRQRLTRRILARHFSALISKYISWRLLPPSNE